MSHHSSAAISSIMTGIIAVTVLTACLVQTAFATYPGLHCPGSVVPYAAGIGVGYAVETAVPYTGPLANPVVLPSGYLADNPDVAVVRGAHLSALATTQALSGNYASGYVATVAPPAEVQTTYKGPQASPVVLPSGYLADTNDVAAARGAHLSAVASSETAASEVANNNGGSTAANGPVYNGPVASTVVLPSGYIADTREVFAARGAHLAAVARTSASTPPSVQTFGLRQLVGPAVVAALPTRYVADAHEISVTRGSHVTAQSGCETCVNDAK